MSRQVILAHRAADTHGPGIKAKVAAHDADTVITVPGKVVEGGMHPAKQPRVDQLELDLFQGPAVKLLRHLNLEPEPGCCSDDAVGLVESVGDRGL
jgi:hypothetical protein